MDPNFIISFIIGFIIAIIFSLEQVRLKFTNISIRILLKLNERKKNKLLNKALFSKSLKERIKAIKELRKNKKVPLHKRLMYNVIKLLLIYVIIISAILLTIGYIVNLIFHNSLGYILGWFMGFIAMFIKNRFF